jgi:hypothetical protein
MRRLADEDAPLYWRTTRVGKGLRTLGVAGAQLAQQGDEGVADQGVDFVEQENQGLRISASPIFEQCHEAVARSDRVALCSAPS